VATPEGGATRRRRLLALLLALVVPPLLVRGCLLDSYVIESESMAPTFLGGGEEPDHLLVLRRGADGSTPQRHDVVVLDGTVDPELPEGIGSVLKRIVGLPGEYVSVERGDLYAGPSSPPPLVRKPDDLIASLLVPVHEGAGLTAPWAWAGPGRREDLPSGGTRLVPVPAGEPGQALFGGLVENGSAGERGGEPVADTALEVVVGEGGAVLELALREGADVFRARLADGARGGATLWHNLGGGVVARAEAFEGLAPGQRVLLWNVDDGVRLRVDGRTLLAWDYERNAAQVPGGPHNEPSLSVDGGSLELLSVRVLRDIHYTAQGSIGTGPEAPCHLGQDHYFILGDNSHLSRDSRYFGPVPGTALRGRPIAIYRPWSRAGWLGRAGVPNGAGDGLRN
jgi:signal peptidase I